MEQFARDFVTNHQDNMQLYYLSAVCFGGVIGWVFFLNQYRLTRSSYFCLSMIILAVARILSTVIYIFMAELTFFGYLWVGLALDFGISIVAGVFLAIIASNRSFDGYGHRGYAWMAFVPIANLFLMFKTTATPHLGKTYVDSGPLHGSSGIIIGILTFAFGVGAATAVQTNVDRNFDRRWAALTESNFDVVSELHQFAGQFRTPVVVDDWTTLTAVNAFERTIHFNYRVSTEISPSIEVIRSNLINSVCNNNKFSVALRNDAVFTHSYVYVDGRDIGSVNISKNQC